MRTIYHVCNDYSLEQLRTIEAEQFGGIESRLRQHTGKVKGAPATFYQNQHGELIYVSVVSDENLEGCEL